MTAFILNINSSGKVDLPKYKEFCQLTAIRILYLNQKGAHPGVQWINMNDTVHEVLYHSWEIIELNGCKGVGALSEELIEATQYYIRHDRHHLAFQGGFIQNLKDTFRGSALRGDMKVASVVNLNHKKTARHTGGPSQYKTGFDDGRSIDEMYASIMIAEPDE